MGAPDTNDAATGESHGTASPLRWDHSTALAVVVLAALAALALIRVSFKTSVSAGVGIGR